MKGSRSRKPKDDLGAAPEPPPEAVKAEESAKVAPAPGGLRCPFCKGDLPNGALAAACASCGTLHHPGCFAEHHGCSTAGCESARGLSVVVGAPPLPPFEPLACAHCLKPCPADAIVARCGCGRVLHTACHEQLKGCGLGARCASRVELLPHGEVVQERLREQGSLLLRFGLGGVVLAALGGWIAFKANLGRDLAAALGTAGIVLVLSLIVFFRGLSVRKRARAATALPPPSRPRAAEDTLKQLERSLGAEGLL